MLREKYCQNATDADKYAKALARQFRVVELIFRESGESGYYIWRVESPRSDNQTNVK